ncbi:DAK2 domain-containing protein [Tissierella pigra]|uniref:DAK2 domain-containing protein n=1 Tax=Tissierella pigra TaxID=2607614 RepID=A0A6N7XRM9_9FIRM|nr:DAK2 domain-containing protein [Tissierella pigra]MBU5426491.1 DAK2 domain-containing protein [Tissierella pigra]MSU00063.1 DAK2 domain-containing protein [Tissierella pigra]
MRIEILDGAMLKKALAGAAKFLEDNKEEVNSLNVFPVPDGDTGTNMSLTVNSAIKQGINLDEDSVSKIALSTSHGSLMGARGNSGVILSQLFRGFANGLNGKDTADIKTIAEAFKQASDTAYKAVMKPTEGTILTVARECGEYAISISKQEKDILIFLKKVIEHGEKALARTPEMLPVLKRAGVVDAGGKGLIYVLTGAYNALAGIENIEIKPEVKNIEKQDRTHHEHIDTDDIKYGYCTEFIINTNYKDIETFREELSVQGDSLLVVGGEGLIKVHVHTNNPGTVLQKALSLGELNDIKIDNMRYQHEEILLKSELSKPKKPYSFVAISIGEGIDEVFKGLNVDTLVSGGQTMNPSTEDILKAIENTTGENVFILPNNSNIILTAEQTKELSDRNVVVIPSKTIPQGIAALLAFDESKSLEENTDTMKEAITYIKTGQVTYSVRDTEFNNTKIQKDDIIGIAEGDIVASGKEINEVSIKLLENMVDEDTSLITILYGSDLSEEMAEDLEKHLSDLYDDLDIELICGGQPIYYYIFSVE